ncbi:hypothetical protein ACFQVC_42400 [Streptomyces monticola]|uniref:Uncharacterized protein n=1 Tax=Streptomyces monticola TaxID=2666263 RepID=A0ABW2JZA1_9ACTN
MVKKPKTPTSRNTPRPRRPALRLGALNATSLVIRLRELYEAGQDPQFDRFPAPEELLLVLRHTERTAHALTPVDGQDIEGEAAVLRAKLWQYVREQADSGQLRAIEDGRAAGVPWHRFNEALCVTTKHGAYQKARRLKAEQLREPHEPRTPESARELEDRKIAEERTERLRVSAQERRFTLAQRIARQLLDHRDGLRVSGMAAYWLDELDATIDDRRTPLERANFTTFLESFVRTLHAARRDGAPDPTTTEPARHALTLAADFAEQPHPEIPHQTDATHP